LLALSLALRDKFADLNFAWAETNFTTGEPSRRFDSVRRFMPLPGWIDPAARTIFSPQILHSHPLDSSQSLLIPEVIAVSAGPSLKRRGAESGGRLSSQGLQFF
jgi:hypothetical protein